MAFRDCMLSAVEQGAISRQEADDLMARFDDAYGQARLSLGDEAAAKAAKDALAAELKFEAIETRRRVVLQDGARQRILEHFQSYRDPFGKADIADAALKVLEHYGYAGISSVHGKAKAITALAHGQMADVLTTFRRKFSTGGRMNRPMEADVVRGLFGEASPPEAGALAKAIGDTMELLRQRFNAAGGSIAKLDKWGLPQSHDAVAILKADKDPWKDFIRPLLDRERMRDPLTGGAMTEQRLDQALDYAWDTIATNGVSKREPSMQARGRGSLATQRADHRFLIFKDADAWMAYDRQFGHGDPLRSVFEHVNAMAKDIATMEVLGPNPSAMVEWMKQMVAHEAGERVRNRPSLYQGSREKAQGETKGGKIGRRLDAMYQYLRGGSSAGEWAAGFGDVRNVLTSAQLGSGVIAAGSTDPFVDAATRMLSGLPVGGAFGAITKTGSRLTREEAVRSGILLDDFLHIVQDQARWAGTLGGHEWSRWLADRTVTWSGLSPITQARKHVFALEFQSTLADNAGKAFGDLPDALRRTMEGYGLSKADWEAMRGVALHKPAEGSAGLLRPIDVAERDPRLAERYVEMILGQTERAVPEGTIRAKTYITGGAKPGTVAGEVLMSMLQYKSFALSFTTLQLEAIMREIGLGGMMRGAKYAGALTVGLTFGGALAMQLKSLKDGKDPEPMFDGFIPNPKFWMQALQTGGGVGLLGDFLFADLNRFGQGLPEMLAGPTFSAAGDMLKLTWGSGQAILLGKNPHLGKEVVGALGHYTPVLSSFWPLRAAYRRVVLDQLQYLVDPNASRNFSEQASRLRRERQQAFTWHPGDIAPTRAPDLARAFGR